MRTLLIIGIVFLVLWALGLINSVTLQGGIHTLLVLGLIMFLIWLIYTMGRQSR